MNTSLFLTRFHLSPNVAIAIFVSFTVSVHTSVPKQLPPSPLPLFTPSMTTATLFITNCPYHPTPTDPEFSCTCCCQIFQNQSHHSHPPVSELVKNYRAYSIQAPLTYLQSSLNHPTFISAYLLHSSASSQHSLFMSGNTRWVYNW